MSTPVLRLLLRAAAAPVLLFGLVACSDDDDGATDSGAPAVEDAGQSAGDDGDAGGEAGQGPSGPGGGGTLELDGETIELTSSLCFLQPQEAAAGGGTIEFNAQASGNDAAGEEVSVDVSRYSEESQFAGDVVVLDRGPATDRTLSAERRHEIGAIEVAGDTLTFEGEVDDMELLEPYSIALTIEC